MSFSPQKWKIRQTPGVVPAVLPGGRGLGQIIAKKG